MASIQNLDVLKASLSSGATVDVNGDENYTTSAARWSDLGTPKPGAVVNVASEADIEATVKWCTANKVPFCAQSGAHAWATWFKVDSSGIVINMRQLNTVEIDMDKKEAVLGGGITMLDAVKAGKKQKAHLMLGVCNGVGSISAMIGGGIGFMQGLYGLGADNMLSARIVTADGVAKTVSPTSNADLWWAVRGAGHNFGILSSVTVRAYPELNQGMHYMNMLCFPDAMLEKVIETLDAYHVPPNIALDMIFFRPPPDFANPVIGLALWHPGSEESARELAKPIFDLGGMSVQSGMVPYDHTNDGLDVYCTKNGFNPCFSRSVNTLTPSSFRSIWNDFIEFSSNPNAAKSIVVVHIYSCDKVFSVPLNETAVGPALRTKRFHSFINGCYTDASLHGKARAMGKSFREKIMAGLDEKVNIYPNFSFGDEEMGQLYGEGERTERLKGLKKKWDPENVFCHYIPIA